MDLNINFDWVEWYGYLASLVVFISLTMTSIIRLRVFNFIGCMIFAHYGLLTGLLPVTVANLSIALINVYYLYQIYRNKEQFNLVDAETESAYYQHFLNVNQSEISQQAGVTELQEVNTSFYMLRNNNIAGILAGYKEPDGSLTIFVDYVMPEYRDFKLGSYYYKQHPEFLKDKGINALKSYASNEEHRLYLEKMGFIRQDIDGDQIYKKTL